MFCELQVDMEGSYPESKIPSCYLGRFFYFPKNLAVKAIVNVQQRERENPFRYQNCLDSYKLRRKPVVVERKATWSKSYSRPCLLTHRLKPTCFRF